MSEISLILLAAGSSSRFGLGTKKQWLRTGDIPLWLFVAKRFESSHRFKEIIVVGEKNEISYMSLFADYIFIEGGKERQDSLLNALNATTSKYVLTADVARCCIDKDMIDRVVSKIDEFDCIVPTLTAHDTTIFDSEYIDRNLVKLVQTPQLSNKQKLISALKNKKLFTDDSGAMREAGYSVGYVEGSKSALKLTSKEDLEFIKCLTPPNSANFCGIGFDTHQFDDQKQCVLGGVAIDGDGFKAHSDGDVLIHSIIDALLGAAGLGDIGEFFPDTDEAYKNADSTVLLKRVLSLVRGVGFEINNVDVSVIAERPRLSRYKNEIKINLAKILQIPPYKLCIKATTSEKMGYVGRGEGVAVLSTASLKFFDWTCV